MGRWPWSQPCAPAAALQLGCAPPVGLQQPLMAASTCTRSAAARWLHTSLQLDALQLSFKRLDRVDLLVRLRPLPLPIPARACTWLPDAAVPLTLPAQAHLRIASLFLARLASLEPASVPCTAADAACSTETGASPSAAGCWPFFSGRERGPRLCIAWLGWTWQSRPCWSPGVSQALHDMSLLVAAPDCDAASPGVPRACRARPASAGSAPCTG